MILEPIPLLGCAFAIAGISYALGHQHARAKWQALALLLLRDHLPFQPPKHERHLHISVITAPDPEAFESNPWGIES